MKFFLFFLFLFISLPGFLNTKFKSNNYLQRSHQIKHHIIYNNQNSYKFKDCRKEFKCKEKILKIIFGTILLFTLISIYKIYEDILTLKKCHLASKYSHVINYDKDKMCIEDLDEKLTFVSGKVNILKGAKDELVNFKEEKEYLRIKREVCVYNYFKEKWEILQENLIDDEILLTEVDLVNFELKESILKVSYEENNYIFPNILTKNFNSIAQLNSINLSSAQIHSIKSNEKRLTDILDFQFPFHKKCNNNTFTLCTEDKEIICFSWM